MLAKLDTLLRQGAGVSKDTVLDFLVDLVAVRGPEMTRQKLNDCFDLVTMMSSMASAEGRASAFERLASLSHTPASRLLAWAAGPIEIAGPVIRHGRNLSNADLVRLLLEATPAHLRAAAGRDSLSENLTDLILLRGDREAIALMLRNRRARISRSSFNALAGMAPNSKPVRDALVQRSDLPGHVVEKLWPALDTTLKARLIVAGWRYSTAEIEEVSREAMREGHERGPGGPPPSFEGYRNLIEGESLSLSAALSEILKAGRLVEAAQVIAGVRGISDGVALNLLFGSYDRGAAILARNLGLKDDVVLLLACARGRLPWVRSTEIRQALSLAEEVSKKEAETIMAILEELWAAGVADTGDRRRVRALNQQGASQAA